MKGALEPTGLERLVHVSDWLEHCRAAVEIVRSGPHADEPNDSAVLLDELTRQNVLLQLQHLRTHPIVAAAVANRNLGLHGWAYSIETGEVHCYDDATASFVPVMQRYAALLNDSDA